MLALLASACVLLPSLYWWPQALASKEMRKDLITTFCSAGVKEGEMLESASPSDPLFWMIHPLLDRMLVAKRLAAVNNMHFGTFGRFKGFEDETWLDYSAYTSDSCVSRLRTLGVFARSNKPTRTPAKATRQTQYTKTLSSPLLCKYLELVVDIDMMSYVCLLAKVHLLGPWHVRQRA